jgi:hypothetical protein
MVPGFTKKPGGRLQIVQTRKQETLQTRYLPPRSGLRMTTPKLTRRIQMTHTPFLSGPITKPLNSNVKDFMRAMFTIASDTLQSQRNRKQEDAASLLQAQNRRNVARRNADNLLR